MQFHLDIAVDDPLYMKIERGEAELREQCCQDFLVERAHVLHHLAEVDSSNVLHHSDESLVRTEARMIPGRGSFVKQTDSSETDSLIAR